MNYEHLTPPLSNIEAQQLFAEAKVAQAEASQRGINILDHHWSMKHPQEAASAVAKVLAALYVRHAIHDNLAAFAEQIAQKQAFVWVIVKDGQVAGSSCLIDNGQKGLELARSGIIPESGAQGVGKIPMLTRVAHWLTDPEFEAFDHLEGTVRMAKTWEGIPGGTASQTISLGKCGFRLFAIEHLFHHGAPLRQEPFGLMVKFRSAPEFVSQNQGLILAIDTPLASNIPLLSSLIDHSGVSIDLQIANPSSKENKDLLVQVQNMGDHTAVIRPDLNGLPLDEAIHQAQESAWFTEIVIPQNHPNNLDLQRQAARLGFQICGFIPNWRNTLELSLKLSKLRPNILVAPIDPAPCLGKNLTQVIIETDARLRETVIK